VILQIRIYALYAQNRRLLVFMFVFYIITTGISAWPVISGMIQAECTSQEDNELNEELII